MRFEAAAAAAAAAASAAPVTSKRITGDMQRRGVGLPARGAHTDRHVDVVTPRPQPPQQDRVCAEVERVLDDQASSIDIPDGFEDQRARVVAARQDPGVGCCGSY